MARTLPLLLTAVLLWGCAEIDGASGWFPDDREYLGECTPPSGSEGGCWWFAFNPAGRVDFASGDDILYRGDYRIRSGRIRITAPHHRDLALGLSAAQDTLWLPHGGHAVRVK